MKTKILYLPQEKINQLVDIYNWLSNKPEDIKIVSEQYNLISDIINDDETVKKLSGFLIFDYYVNQRNEIVASLAKKDEFQNVILKGEKDV